MQIQGGADGETAAAVAAVVQQVLAEETEAGNTAPAPVRANAWVRSIREGSQWRHPEPHPHLR